MTTPAVNSPEWWAEHGVADEVRAARPYVQWTTDDIEPVREAYAGLSESQQRTLLRWARQSDGLVICRHSFERVASDDPRYVYPEIRPDRAVCTETIRHYHGPPTAEPPRHPNTGKPLPKRHVHTPESMQQHIARCRDPDDHCGSNTDKVHSHRNMAKYLFPPRAKATTWWVHSHRKEYEARVLRHIPAEARAISAHDDLVVHGPMTEEHHRLEQEFIAWLEEHWQRHHRQFGDLRSTLASENPRAREWMEETFMLYFHVDHTHPIPGTLRAEQLAKRIDVNPLVWEHGGFEKAERVFFGIEGCIKADSILTALVHADQPPAVFSVPSVSLWEATYPTEEELITISPAIIPDQGVEIQPGDELAAFAGRYLVGKLVCIVPDADAYTKTEVMTQALLCRSTIRRLGARAEIVLPPDDRLDQGIKGIDDYLGVGGGSLDELVWYRMEPPPENDIEAWVREHAEGTTRLKRSDAIGRAVETLEALSKHAGENGEYTGSVHLLARAIGSRKRTSDPPADSDASERNGERAREAARRAFMRGIEDLLAIGAISSNKPLDVRVETWLRTNRGWHREGGFHWEEEGVVITIHEDLRAPAERRSMRDIS